MMVNLHWLTLNSYKCEPHNLAHEQTQQEELEQLLMNLGNQEDQGDQPHDITTTIQAMSMMDIKSNEDRELQTVMQGEQSDQDVSSDGSSSSYRVSEVMCTRPGTPDNLLTQGNCVSGNSSQCLIYFRSLLDEAHCLG